MKKSVWLLSLFMLAGMTGGCADDPVTEEVLDEVCGHGKNINNHCICDRPYANAEDGTCNDCVPGYTWSGSTCVKTGDVSPEEQCLITFDYTNIYTSIASGGEKNFDVYVVGSMTNWQKNKAYKMYPRGDGSHLLKIAMPKDKTYEYKFYIDGWGADSYRVDLSAELKNGNNTFNTSVCGAVYTFNENGSKKYTKHEGANLNDVQVNGQKVTVYLSLDNGYEITGVDGASTYHITEAEPQAEPTITVTIDENFINALKSHGYPNADTMTPKDVLDALEKIVLEEGVFTVDGQEVNLSSIAILREIIEASSGGMDAYTHILEIDVPAGTNKYAFTVKTSTDDGKTADIYLPVWVENKPFDWHEAVLYFAFTDRFADGNPANNEPKTSADNGAEWKGGDFKGLQQKVESGYFDSLGVNTLWISSVNMNTQGVSMGTNGDSHAYSAYHSYWPITTFMTDDNKDEFTSSKSAGVNITAIEPHFGTMDDLKSLVEACHKRGIRVLVDFAANHVHRDSPIYINHKEWFYPDQGSYICDSDGNWDKIPESCWFSQDLPDINYELPEPRKLMVEHAKWLIRETNIDGFRVDAVKHMNIQFIRDLRSGIEDLFHNTNIVFYTVGETFSYDVGLLNKYIGDDLLMAQFDFPYYGAIQSMLKGDGLGGVSSPRNHYNSDLMGTFMGNHDVARALSVAAGDFEGKWGMNGTPDNDTPFFRLKIAWTILLTTPGVPLIYYGDEFGMPGSNDPDNRRMMLFDNALNERQKSTLAYVQKLGKLRHDHPVMARGTVETLDKKERDGKVIAWCYKVSDESESIIVGVATDACGSDDCGCGLQTQRKLKDLLEPGNPDIQVDGLDMRTEKLKVYQEK